MVSVKQSRPPSACAGAVFSHQPSGASTNRSRGGPSSWAEQSRQLSAPSASSAPKSFGANGARHGRESGVDRARDGRARSGRKLELEMRLGRQAHFLAHGEVGVELERRGLRGIARLDRARERRRRRRSRTPRRRRPRDALRRRKLHFHARDIVGSGKVERRRQAGVAGIAPIRDRARLKSNLEPREIAAARDEARLRLGGSAPNRSRTNRRRTRARRQGQAKARPRARLRSAGLLRPRKAS